LLGEPAGRLLGAVVGAARGVQVAFVGWPVGVGDDVVLVGVDGLAAAAGTGAGLGTGADQVPQPAAGGIAGLGMPVIARPLGDPLQRAGRQAQIGQELLDAGGPFPGVWRGAGAFGLPGVAAAGARVGDCLAVVVDDGEALPGSWVLRGGLDDVAGFLRAGQAPGAGLAGGGAPAEESGGGDDEVDKRGKLRPARGGHAGAG
jgi:hypothetical protein